ncbi:hypothetical protein CSIM01_03520 [Colletotrichum simmondsii]|uniref:C6 zinc finger protein n=1 Tax=Colletotrichum simmondsii TaxID=703756 RepID=A0A135RYX7_9PEZI|nr:hypothetical protein CSIM01_03520 [Colletotrichum simmondsii]
MVLLAPLKRHSPTNANTVSNEDANSNQLVPIATRKRAKHTRTRLGCATCRCSSTGRVCDFVEDSNNERRGSLLAKSAYVSIVPRPNPNDAIYQPAPQTGRWINFYQGHSAPEFAGYFDVEFWSTTILQLSYREQCVHQMLVAIGSLHESLKSGLAQQSDPHAVNLYKYAEAEYTTAVSLLNTHMTHRGWSALEITLVCSILGIMFEWLRGGYQDAVRHLTSSFKILSTWLSHNAPPSTTTFGSPGGHLIRSQIKPIFHILVLQSRMLPIPPSVPPKVVQAPEQNIPDFSSVAHARNVQLDLLTYVLVVPLKVAGSKERTRQVVAEPLRQWSDKFALFISQQPHLASDPCGPWGHHVAIKAQQEYARLEDNDPKLGSS